MLRPPNHAIPTGTLVRILKGVRIKVRVPAESLDWEVIDQPPGLIGVVADSQNAGFRGIVHVVEVPGVGRIGDLAIRELERLER